MQRLHRKRVVDSSEIRGSHLSIYDQMHQARSCQLKKAKPEVEEIDVFNNDQPMVIDSPPLSRKREVEDQNMLHIPPHAEYEKLSRDRDARGKKSKSEEMPAREFWKFPAVFTASNALHWKKAPGILKPIAYEEEMLQSMMQSLTL